ncbi:MAG: hypothetical protein IT488_07850 [Gammaproteobacteria bacterium]|nr:hypothetical protein [Gammaproteobacteria bacterium]
MKIKFHKLVLMAGAMALGSLAFAAGLPDYYPEKFDRWGVIDQLDLENRVIVVNDVGIKIAHDLRIYTTNTRFAAPQSLKPGMRIGFGTTGSRSLAGPVTEVWVLPPNYTPTRDSGSETGDRRKGRE